MICRRDRVSLYTLNGSLLLEQILCDSVDDSIMTCVFYEGVNNEWQERELLFTGHRRGVVNVRALWYSHGFQVLMLMDYRFGARSSITGDLSWS